MSEPKRYAIRGFSAALVEEENGKFVRWEDYAKLDAEKWRWANRECIERQEKLEAEIERLKAETIKQIETAMPPIEAYIAQLEAKVHELTMDKALSEPRLFIASQDIRALNEKNEEYAQEARTLYDFMSRFDWILYAHNCKGGASDTHEKLDKLREDYLNWKNPQEEHGL